MPIPPIQRVPRLLKSLLLESSRAAKSGSSQPQASAPDTAATEDESCALADELAQLTRGIDTEDSVQVAKLRPSLVDAILRHEFGPAIAVGADYRKTRKRIEQAVCAVLDDGAWADFIRTIQHRASCGRR